MGRAIEIELYCQHGQSVLQVELIFLSCSLKFSITMTVSAMGHLDWGQRGPGCSGVWCLGGLTDSLALSMLSIWAK